MKNLNTKTTLNTAKLVLIQNELNKKSKKVKLISAKAKGLTKSLISNKGILNGGKRFVENGSHNYLHFNPFLDTLLFLRILLKLFHGS